MKNPSLGAKLASQKYVNVKGGSARLDKTIKPHVKKPTVKPKFMGNTFGKAGREGLKEDKGLI